MVPNWHEVGCTQMWRGEYGYGIAYQGPSAASYSANLEMVTNAVPIANTNAEYIATIADFAVSLTEYTAVTPK